ncbi:hypothetical protein [Kitasatospora sp. NPDC018619]|uniref:hypothetical protein n=1 Tax=unclassified Kitasatospora TaxID=2633591 RepID=UPI0037A821EE
MVSIKGRRGRPAASAATALPAGLALGRVGGPEVLTGRSSGGTSAGQAAADDPEARVPGHVAAFLPAPGQSAPEPTDRDPGPPLPDALGPAARRQADGTAASDPSVRRAARRHRSAADAPAGKAASAARPSRPGRAVVTTGDLGIPPAAHRSPARRTHAEAPAGDAPHAVAASRPRLVAEVVGRAARTTPR